MADEKKESVKPPECAGGHEPNHVTRMVLRRSHSGKDVRSFDSLDALLDDLGLRQP